MGKRVLFVVGALYLVGLSLLCATAIEHGRASSRHADLLARYDEVLRKRNDRIAERDLVASPFANEFSLIANLSTLDDALDRGRFDVAARAWHDAYGAALGTRQWESMAEVADAALRIAATPTGAAASRAQARQSYLITLYRARAAGSVDGVLRVAKAFHGLGDRAATMTCLEIAADLALRNGDESERARVRTVMEQMTGATRRP